MINKNSGVNAIVLSATIALSGAASADEHEMPGAQSVVEAVKLGKAQLGFRYRFEAVDQDGKARDANASTLRTRLNYKTASLNGITGFIEIDNVTYLGDDNFNNLRNGQSQFPVVADPKGTAINQLTLSYKLNDTDVILGRQRINLDGQRFMGGVGWRQNEQTFDALTVKSEWSSNVKLQYSYLNKIHSIFGPDAGTPDKEIDSNSHIVNTRIKLAGGGALSLYGYFMDLESASKLSNRTLGLSYTDSFSLGNIKMPIHVEYAQQQDYGDNLISYKAAYYRVETGVDFSALSLRIGNEVLEGDKQAGKAFRTPLATLHKFQGWSDKFLATPDAGIDDLYLSLSTKLKQVKLGLSYHVFESETGNIDYGTETNISVAYKFNKNYGVLLKAARYDADEYSADTTKIWLMLTAKF